MSVIFASSWSVIVVSSLSVIVVSSLLVIVVLTLSVTARLRMCAARSGGGVLKEIELQEAELEPAIDVVLRLFRY